MKMMLLSFTHPYVVSRFAENKFASTVVNCTLIKMYMYTKLHYHIKKVGLSVICKNQTF